MTWIFANLPSPSSFNELSLSIEIDTFFKGEWAITMRPGRSSNHVAPVRGAVAGPDDADQRLATAVLPKKRQVKRVNTPVLLAISVSPFGDREDFDRGLCGLTLEEVGISGKVISQDCKSGRRAWSKQRSAFHDSESPGLS